MDTQAYDKQANREKAGGHLGLCQLFLSRKV